MTSNDIFYSESRRIIKQSLGGKYNDSSTMDSRGASTGKEQVEIPKIEIYENQAKLYQFHSKT